MPKTIVVKEFHSFAELAEHARFEASKGKNRQPRKLPPPPKQPVLTSHEPKPVKPKVKGRVNARRGR